MVSNFGPATDSDVAVFGAARPGYRSRSVAPQVVADWLNGIAENGIERICCLLPPEQLAYYESDLLAAYRDRLGPDNTLWVPITDYALASEGQIQEIVAFLDASGATKQRVVVHCSGGSGRTGHVLAAWACHSRGLDPEAAINAVRTATGSNRNPTEAVSGSVPIERLHDLLQTASSQQRGSKA